MQRDKCNCNDSDCNCCLVPMYQEELISVKNDLGAALRNIYAMRGEDKLISDIFNSESVQRWIND